MRTGVDQPVFFYHPPVGETAAPLALMRLIDAQFLETPWYRSLQMARHLRRNGHEVGRKRVRRLMTRMGLAPIYQRPRTTVPHAEHRIYPYLLRDLMVNRPNQVVCGYHLHPGRRRFLYLVTVMDWSTRKVLAWRVSDTMDVAFCIEGLCCMCGRPLAPKGPSTHATQSLVGQAANSVTSTARRITLMPKGPPALFLAARRARYQNPARAKSR